MCKIRLRQIFNKLGLKCGISAVVLFVGIVACSLSWAGESSNGSECVKLPEEMPIDQAWGGARVAFDALENENYLYVAYYDAARWLSVVQIEKCTGKLRKIRIPSRFGGWDEHNSITLTLDVENRLHVAGNMHVSHLVYARMDAPDKLSGLDVLRPMTGKDEVRTTYPYFFRFADGALGFSYRSGQSGDGVEFINRFNGVGWTRWVNQPVFSPERGGDAVSAYHTNYVLGPDGFFHVAWVWRRTYKVETNFDVNYAKSADLKTWENSAGQTLTLPITPGNAEIVDPVPEGHGLFNNVRLGFDNAGRPVISYLKFDATGATQLFHARHESSGWKSVPATKWTYRWDPRGGGTIPSEISFSGVSVRNGRLIEQIHQPEIGVKTFVYDDDSLRTRNILSRDVWEPAIYIKNRHPPDGAMLNVETVRTGNLSSGNVKHRYAISWFSLPVDNRDKPRNCESGKLPCNFISELILHTVQDVSTVK